MSTSTPTRYKPSNMIQALGLQAYDFRNDDSSASGSSDGDDDSSNSNGSNNNSDDENSDDDGTKFDDGTNSNSNSRSASSSLRNSIETSAMDTVMTGDHVGALLKAYENEEDMPLPERWTQRRDSNCSSSRGSSSDDGLGAYDALLKNHSSVSNDRASNSGKEEQEAEATIRQRLNNAYAQVLTDESEHSGKSPRMTIIPTFKIKQSRKRRATNGSSGGESQLSSSLETNKEYEADMDELNKDFDEAESTSEADDLEKNIGGPMGENKDEHPVMFPHNYTSSGHLKSSTGKSTMSAQQSLKSSFSGHSNATPTMDNLTLQKLLFMDDDNDNDCEHQQDRNDSSSSPGRYHNLRGSLTSLKDNLAEKDFRGSLTNLKDNLAEKASLLSSSLGDTYVVRQTVPCNFENKRGKKMKRKCKRKKSVDSNDATIRRNGDGADDDESQQQSSGQDTDSGHDTDEEMGELQEQKEGEERQDSSLIEGLDKVQESTFIDERSSMFNSYRYMQRDGGQPYFYRPGQRTIKRCIGVLFAIAIIAVSSALIGIGIEDKNNNEDEAVHSPAPLEDEAPLEESMDAIIEHSQYTREDLFQMAKSVDDHCHAEQLSTAHGRWECQQICHDHFCCFDFDVGDEAYNCRNDESKLCPIFAGCEVLVINDFVSGSSIVATGGAINTQAQNGGSSSYGGSESSTTSYNNAGVMQNEDNNNMGWKEIRKKYINVYCSESNVRSKEGRKQCEKVCENSFCCFDTVPGGNNCRDNKDMTCDAYESCQILLAEVNLIDNNGVDQSPGGVPAGAGSDPGLPPPQDVHMPPDMVGDDISTDPMLGQWDDSTINMLGYTKQELLVMKADIKERCKDYQSPTGRLQCEKMCKFHFCCFNDSEDGCQDNPAKLCHVYDECKVLTSTVKDGNKGETKAPQAALISPETEQDMMGDDNHSEGYGNSKQISADNADPNASAPETLEPSPKPSQELAPEPTSKPTLETPLPAMVTTSQTTAQTSSTAAAGKLPKPPPIRCIPDGDDDLHTEVYTDDWNDDRYDRCKRWENKHGMSISKYWDLQGIDSTLEKNILENMLIMDNSDVEAFAEDEPSGGRNLAPTKLSLKERDFL